MYSVIRQSASKAKPLLDKALDLIFPPRCPSCRELVSMQGALCPDCWQKIHFITTPLCECCGLPLPYAALGEQLCTACLQERPQYHKARAAMQYDEHSKRMLLGLKFYDKTSLVPTLAQFMNRAGSGLFAGTDMILPVPIPWRRLWMRKYNQAALLAFSLSHSTHIPCHTRILIRAKDTPPQAGLTRKQRLENVRTAFAVNEKHQSEISGKTILLVDDTMTTGATFNACAKALLKAGAGEIRALAVARTVLAH